eukprot:gene4232-biopygen18937
MALTWRGRGAGCTHFFLALGWQDRGAGCAHFFQLGLVGVWRGRSAALHCSPQAQAAAARLGSPHLECT